MSDGEVTVRIVKDGLGRVWYEGALMVVRSGNRGVTHITFTPAATARVGKALRHARRYLALLLADNFEVISE